MAKYEALKTLLGLWVVVNSETGLRARPPYKTKKKAEKEAAILTARYDKP